MADLYEQWLEKAEGQKGSFITNEEGQVVFIGGPGSGGGSSSTGSVNSVTAENQFDVWNEVRTWEGDRGRTAAAAANDAKYKFSTELLRDDNEIIGIVSYREKSVFDLQRNIVDGVAIEHLAAKRSGLGDSVLSLVIDRFPQKTIIAYAHSPEGAKLYERNGFIKAVTGEWIKQ